MRTIEDILRSNELNTYVMSCYPNKDELYKQMREDIRMLCGQIEPLVMQKNYGQILSGVDEEIRSLVDILNRNGYETVASCSGHGKLPGNIALKDGRELFIIENYDKARLATKLLIEAGLYSRLNE